RFLARFFHHHGMLSLRDRPRWFTVAGGSHTYVRALTAAMDVRTGMPVRAIRRLPGGVRLQPGGRFDEVVIATHSDQALRLLADPTPDERRILGAIPYQDNEAVLHT